jgi:hypothetical protein
MQGFSLLRSFAIAISAVLVLLDLGLRIDTSYPGLFVLTVAAAVLFYPYRYSSMGAVILLTCASIYVTPYLSLLFIREPVNLAWFGLFNIVATILLVWTERDGQVVEHGLPETSITVNFFAMLAILIGGLGVIALRPESTTSGPIYLSSWGLALLPLERLHWSAGRLVRLAAAGVFVLFILVYAIFVWEGDGRIVVLSLALAPVLLTSLYRSVRLNGALLAGAGIVMVFFGRVLRFGWSGGLAGVAEDSGATHILMTSQLWRGGDHAFPITTFWDQYVLYFFNWVPRNLWPNKPLGVNYSFVDVFIGRAGLGEEFSTALGYFGENLFYSRTFWPLMVVIVTITTVYTRKALVRFTRPYVAPMIIFDVWMITLFWGGMAVFASRTWFSLFPIMAAILVLRRRARPLALPAPQHV